MFYPEKEGENKLYVIHHDTVYINVQIIILSHLEIFTRNLHCSIKLSGEKVIKMSKPLGLYD